MDNTTGERTAAFGDALAWTSALLMAGTLLATIGYFVSSLASDSASDGGVIALSQLGNFSPLFGGGFLVVVAALLCMHLARHFSGAASKLSFVAVGAKVYAAAALLLSVAAFVGRLINEPQALSDLGLPYDAQGSLVAERTQDLFNLLVTLCSVGAVLVLAFAQARTTSEHEAPESSAE